MGTGSWVCMKSVMDERWENRQAKIQCNWSLQKVFFLIADHRVVEEAVWGQQEQVGGVHPKWAKLKWQTAPPSQQSTRTHLPFQDRVSQKNRAWNHNPDLRTCHWNLLQTPNYSEFWRKTPTFLLLLETFLISWWSAGTTRLKRCSKRDWLTSTLVIQITVCFRLLCLLLLNSTMWN